MASSAGGDGLGVTSPEQWTGEDWLLRSLWVNAGEYPDDLRELISVVVAAGEGFDARSTAEVAASIPEADVVDPGTRAAIAASVDAMLADAAAAVDRLDAGAVAARFEGVAPIELFCDPLGAAAPLLAELVPAVEGLDFGGTVSTEAEALFAMAYMKASVRTARTQLLLRALFVTAVAAVEPLLGRLLPRLYLQESPGRYVSLADPVLAKVVRKAGYGGPEHWRKVLVNRLDLTVLNGVVPWAELETAWEERNSLHHRGGHADIHKAHEAGRPLGETTEITVDYLRDTIDRVQVTMVAVVLAGMDRLQPGSAAPFAHMSATGFSRAYRAGQWDLAEGLAALRLAFPVEPGSAVNAQVEVWMARVGRDGPEALAAEVTAWETEELPPLYAVARNILLGRLDEAAAAVDALQSSGDLGPADLAAPLFDPLREHIGSL